MTGALALLSLLSAVRPQPDVETLVRNVIASQRRAERALPPHTYDLDVLETSFARDGRPKDVERKRYAVTSEGGGGEAARELLERNGRPATEAEKRSAAEEDAKARRKRFDRRAAAEASQGARVSGDEDDPAVGPRRLSELLALYDYKLEGEEVHDGRLCWVLSFRGKADAKTRTLGERALAALTGRVIVDEQDLQVRGATARLLKPVRVAGGLAANVDSGSVLFEAQRVAGGYWLPCRIDLRLHGTTAILFRLDKAFAYRMANFRRFSVSTETAVARRAAPRGTH